jgi:sugar phosphate isomerase/epimerase
VKDFAGSLRDPNGARRYLIPGEGTIDFNAVFSTLRRRGYEGSLTLEVSAVKNDGNVDEQRFRQAETWLASRPWLHPV